MEFNHEIRQFQLLKRFYSTHVHPILPILMKEQYYSIETENYVVLEYKN